MVTAISGPRGGREGAGEAVASGTGQRVSRRTGWTGPRNIGPLCPLPSGRAPASDPSVWSGRSRQAPSFSDCPSLTCPTACPSLPFRGGLRVPHTILEVKMEGRPGSWGPGEGRGLSPGEVRAGAPLASAVARPEEMAEGARQRTPQHSCVP